MTMPRVTTGISTTQDELKDFFENHASIAFDHCWDAHCKINFYTKLLADIKKGLVLSQELPEAKGLPISVIRTVIQKQHKQAVVAAESAWELADNIAREFRTTIRSAIPAGETVPQYDIEYKARNTKEPAKILINTWRRNIKVELSGADSALEELHRLIMLAVLKS
jgi:hypothetical protein